MDCSKTNCFSSAAKIERSLWRIRIGTHVEPLVSILIPACNAEKWIADTIRSAQAQTWPRKEIIVVDDGSRDRTLAIARGFSDSEITVETQSNAGASAARNRAFVLSRGDYIQWLDADDLLAPDKIALQMAKALAHGNSRTLFSAEWGGFSYRQSRADFSPTPLWHDLAPLEWLLRKWENNAHMQTATWLASRELTEAAGPWDTRLSMDDDGEYFFRMVRASDGIRFVQNAKVYYRITSFSRLSHVGRSREKMESQFLSMRLQIDNLLAISNEERARSACLNYLRTWLPTFYPERPDLVAAAQEIARNLGGELDPPCLSWKYQWIARLFGPHAGKAAQHEYNRCKSSLFRTWDKILYSAQRLPAGSVSKS